MLVLGNDGVCIMDDGLLLICICPLYQHLIYTFLQVIHHDYSFNALCFAKSYIYIIHKSIEICLQCPRCS